MRQNRERGRVETVASVRGKQDGLSLGDGWRAELVKRHDRGALLRVAGGPGTCALEIEISLTAAGPVLRARAAGIEIESDGDLVARCNRFRVEAREAVELLSAGLLRAEGLDVDVRATAGSARVRASDDVQLLGEQVLLNCDRPPPLPPWIAGLLPVERTIPRQDEGGDPDLLQATKPD